MSQISRVVIGGAVAAVTLGAIQFASGNDLRTVQQGTVQQESLSDVSVVNRVGKADRSAVVGSPSPTGRTLLFRVQGLSDTSVLMRTPVATVKVEAFKSVTTPGQPALASRKSTVACEPPVSMLTEVAKLLQPGRCVT
ncbi:MAG: hypothetical protein JWR89_1937 [Tardiphaga sp.]|uniref:hypothetical protein n=1 Tax=Tardiphaga sp. TaxID=1926292 RepID=UPI00261116C0|nr:hypothetical protein [Tardiphaga sp.]MDB5502035.1 hypothetical protein [Tardiphaga sp.]